MLEIEEECVQLLIYKYRIINNTYSITVYLKIRQKSYLMFTL